MKKEANGKRGQKLGRTGQRIPIERFSTKRWPVHMKHSSARVRDGVSHVYSLPGSISPLRARELDLGQLFTAIYQQLAA